MKRTPFRRHHQRSAALIMPDGRERLTGKFWQEQRKAVWERDDHRCQMPTWFKPNGEVAERCLTPVALEKAHIDHINRRNAFRTLPDGRKVKGRDDRLENLRTLCWFHHKARHDGERRLYWFSS